jgi:hypothetical protein
MTEPIDPSPVIPAEAGTPFDPVRKANRVPASAGLAVGGCCE